jgi:hypothetical protein
MKLLRIGTLLLTGYTATGVLMMLPLRRAPRPALRSVPPRRR